MKGRDKSMDTAENKTHITHTVLVVEDDEFVCRLIQDNLRQVGFHVEGVFNGTDAISWIASNRTVLMLLDYRLPDMTGKQVIEVLAQRQCSVPFRNPPVIPTKTLIVKLLFVPWYYVTRRKTSLLARRRQTPANF